jgi:hypothetical protein
MDREVSRWLEEKHNITWTKSNIRLYRPNIALTIDDSTPGEAEIESTVSIKWNLKNNEKFPLHRASIFVRCDESDFETQEILVGTVPPGKSISGTIEAPILASVKSPSLYLNMGVVVDGTPLPHRHAEHLLQVREKPLAFLHAELEITEENGGSLPGILEHGEKAKLRLLVKNQGSATGSQLKLGVINLAGSQLEVTNIPKNQFDLKPGASIALPINIDAGQMVDTNEMSLGICVDGKNLQTPLRQRATLKSQPSRKFSSEKSSAIGH